MPWDKQFDKKQVLDKAMEAFWAKGFEATSMQDLVDCTGINRGSLYATYGDKRALFLSALKAYQAERDQMLAAVADAYEPREAIRQVFLSFMHDRQDSGAARGCFMTNTALELAAHDPEIRGIVAGAQDNVAAFLYRMVKKGKASGEFPGHLKTTEAARGLLASLLGFLVLVRSRNDRAFLQSVADDALRRLT
jgi:TetR/AcrR family transcriptional repressor of nem operon